MDYEALAPVDQARPSLPKEIFSRVETQLKYQGYIKRQKAAIAESRRLEQKPLPVPMEFGTVRGLRLEAAEKLNRIQPLSLGQASRISGVTPADVAVLMIWLEKHKKEGEAG